MEGSVLAFIVRRWEGEPVACGSEGSELRFFPPDELPDDMLPMHRQTIEDYRTYDGTFLLPS